MCVGSYFKALQKKLKLLEHQAQHVLQNNFQKRWLDLKANSFSGSI